jgi:hypothetical protein
VSIVGLVAPGFLSELYDAIPDTDLDECRSALAEGRYIDASFACPAGTFLRELVTGFSDGEEEDDQEEEP